MFEVPLRVSGADEEEREGGRPSVGSEEPRSPKRKAGRATFSDPQVRFEGDSQLIVRRSRVLSGVILFFKD
jgi:hypothetical protein